VCTAVDPVVNTITVTFSTNVPLDQQTSVVITKLTGASPVGGGTPTLGGTDSSLFVASFDDGAKKLTLTPKPTVSVQGVATKLITKPGRDYIVSFNVNNPRKKQAGPDISIEATGGAVMIPGVLMTSDDSYLDECSKDDQSFLPRKALNILDRKFCVKKGYQLKALPVATANDNVVTVTLATTVPLYIGAKITLNGLQGSPVSSTLPTGFTLDSSDNNVFIFSVSTATVRATPHVFTFTVTNGVLARGAWTLTVSSAAQTSDPGHFSAASIPLEKPLAGDACTGDHQPGKVYAPVLCVKNIRQSTAFPAVRNTITATFRANVDISNTVNFELTGLTNLGTDADLVAGGHFASLERTSTNKVVAKLANQMTALQDMTLQFVTTNPRTVQASPDVRVTVGTLPDTAMTKDTGKTLDDYDSHMGMPVR
jgi:hypothetical protein